MKTIKFTQSIPGAYIEGFEARNETRHVVEDDDAQRFIEAGVAIIVCESCEDAPAADNHWDYCEDCYKVAREELLWEQEHELRMADYEREQRERVEAEDRRYQEHKEWRQGIR